MPGFNQHKRKIPFKLDPYAIALGEIAIPMTDEEIEQEDEILKLLGEKNKGNLEMEAEGSMDQDSDEQMEEDKNPDKAPELKKKKVNPFGDEISIDRPPMSLRERAMMGKK